MNHNKHLYQLKLNDFGEVVNFLGFFNGLDTQKSVINVAPGWIVTDKDGTQHVGGQFLQVGNPKLETGEPVRTFEDFTRWVSDNQDKGYQITQDANAQVSMPERYSSQTEQFESYKVGFREAVGQIFEASKVLPDKSGTEISTIPNIDIDDDTLRNRLIFYREQMILDIQNSELEDSQKIDLIEIASSELSNRFESERKAKLLFSGVGVGGVYTRSHFTNLKLNIDTLRQSAVIAEARIDFMKKQQEKNECNGKNKNSKDCLSFGNVIEVETSVIETNRLVSFCMGLSPDSSSNIMNKSFTFLVEAMRGTSKSSKTLQDEHMEKLLKLILTPSELEIYNQHLSGGNPFQIGAMVDADFLRHYLPQKGTNVVNAFLHEYNTKSDKKNSVNAAVHRVFLEIDDVVSGNLIGNNFIGFDYAQKLRESTHHGTLINGILAIEDDKERLDLYTAYKNALSQSLDDDEITASSNFSIAAKKSIGNKIKVILDGVIEGREFPQKFDGEKVEGVASVLKTVRLVGTALSTYALIFDSFKPDSSVDIVRRAAINFLRKNGITDENASIAVNGLFSLGYTSDGTIHSGMQKIIVEHMPSDVRKKYDLLDNDNNKVNFVLNYFIKNIRNITFDAETAAAARVRAGHGEDLITVDKSGINALDEGLSGENSVFVKKPEDGQPTAAQRIFNVGEKILEFRKIKDQKQRAKKFNEFLNSEEVNSLLDSFGFTENHPSRETARDWIFTNMKSSLSSSSSGKGANVGQYTEFLTSLATAASIMKEGDVLETKTGTDGILTFDELIVVGQNGLARCRIISNDSQNGYSDAVVVFYNQENGKIEKVHSLEYKTNKTSSSATAPVSETEPFRKTLRYIQNFSINNTEDGDLEDETIPMGELIQLTIVDGGKKVFLRAGLSGAFVGQSASGAHLENTFSINKLL